ncbi:MAG: hypothetical protein ACOX5R_04220 [bacterium]
MAQEKNPSNEPRQKPSTTSGTFKAKADPAAPDTAAVTPAHASTGTGGTPGTPGGTPATQTTKTQGQPYKTIIVRKPSNGLIITGFVLTLLALGALATLGYFAFTNMEQRNMESFENIASTIRTFRLEQQSAIGGIPDSFQQTLNETQRQAMNNINAMNQQMADWMIQAASPLNTIEVLQSEILELRAALQSQQERDAQDANGSISSGTEFANLEVQLDKSQQAINDLRQQLQEMQETMPQRMSNMVSQSESNVKRAVSEIRLNVGKIMNQMSETLNTIQQQQQQTAQLLQQLQQSTIAKPQQDTENQPQVQQEPADQPQEQQESQTQQNPEDSPQPENEGETPENLED